MPADLPQFLTTLNTALRWHHHPRNGKVARLPEPTRALINHLLDDGFPYRAIIDQLQRSGALPYTLSEMNLSNWYRGGHQDWRRNQLQAAAGIRPAQFDRPATADGQEIEGSRTKPHQTAPSKANVFSDPRR